jgi:hypothetical protein
MKNFTVGIQAMEELIENSSRHERSSTGREISIVAPNKSDIFKTLHRELSKQREFTGKGPILHPQTTEGVVRLVTGSHHDPERLFETLLLRFRLPARKRHRTMLPLIPSLQPFIGFLMSIELRFCESASQVGVDVPFGQDPLRALNEILARE